MAANSTKSRIIMQDNLLKGGFVGIPVAVALDDRLTTPAKFLYGMIGMYCYRNHGQAPSQATIASDLGCTEKTLRSYIEELREAQLIETKRDCPTEAMTYFVLPFSRYYRARRRVTTTGQSGSDDRTHEGSSSRRSIVQEQEHIEKADTSAPDGAPLDPAPKVRQTPECLAIQAAYDAFPLSGVATDPKGAPKRLYSGLLQLIKARGLPQLAEWTRWLKSHPQTVPDGADPWAYFCAEFRKAMGPFPEFHKAGGAGTKGASAADQRGMARRDFGETRRG